MDNTEAGFSSAPVVAVVDPRPTDGPTYLAGDRRQQLRFRFVRSCEAAVSLAHFEPIDLWIVCMALPGGGAFELLETIRGENRDVPILLVCDQHRVEEERRALAGGASGYVTRPLVDAFIDGWRRRRVNVARANITSCGDRLTLGDSNTWQ